MNVTEWLRAGDPAIRWQVMRDLIGAPPDDIAVERARVEHEGWGARLLALEDDDGLWDGGASMVTRSHLPRPSSLRHRRRDRWAKSVDHVARAAGARPVDHSG